MDLKTWTKFKRGRLSELARTLGCEPQVVWGFANGRKVPDKFLVPIESATNGEVTCEELRPDLAADFAYLRASQNGSAAQKEIQNVS